MALKRNVPFKGIPGKEPRLLTQDDLKGAFDLYEKVVGNARGFDAMQFIRGVYYGIEVDGHLVSMAGTQTISPQYKTATVGNVITDDRHRGNGYAMACTYLLSQNLKENFDCIDFSISTGCGSYECGNYQPSSYSRCRFISICSTRSNYS